MAKFEIGDTVWCIDDSGCIYITRARQYKVVVRGSRGDGYVMVRNDGGCCIGYSESRFERVNEMDEKGKIEAQIKQNQTDQKKICEEGERLCKELKELEVTYSIGDRFRFRGKKYILAAMDIDKAQIIALNSGCRWVVMNNKVDDLYEITQRELGRITDADPFVRYWDNRKEVNCDN